MSQEIQRQLKQFFPTAIMSLDAVSEALVDGDILVKPKEILRYVQTALLDDKVLEVEHDGLPSKYFTRMKDWIPPVSETQAEGEGEEGEDEYKEGDYLLAMEHIFTLPVEPGMGNLRLRNSKAICMRMSTSSFDVEFGTTFIQQDVIDNLAVLKLAFPSIVRLVHTTKEYRAKVPESMLFTAVLEHNDHEIPVEPVNISISGMSISLDKQQQRLFQEGDVMGLKLFIEEKEAAYLSCSVRHLAKIRKNTGVQYLCGISFDLGSRANTRAIESTVAAVQRAHLKELSDKSNASGIKLVM